MPLSFNLYLPNMRSCSVCKKECEKPERCSQCPKTMLVSIHFACSECNVSFDYSGPGTAISRFSRIEELAWADRRANPQPVGACDGCFRRFRGFPSDDGEEEQIVDAGDAFKHCTQCDWTVCEDCMHPRNQGEALGNVIKL